MPRLIKFLLGGVVGCVALAAASIALFLALDRVYPPPLEITVSTEVVDRDGALLRAFATTTGHWRLAVDLDTVDPQFLKMLVAYEDRRFWSHHGVDLFAAVRAARQLMTEGRIVSGASTLSMQLARLIEPRESRSIGAKIRQAFRAVQIERRLTKREILERYLTLAPYGGNLEGVRAASLAWFGKEPRKLSVAESALLVALPQLPEKRRPDRNPLNAETARNRVLQRMADTGVIVESEIGRARVSAIPTARRALPSLAAHVAEAALRKDPAAKRLQVKLKRSVQQGLELAAAHAAARLGPRVSIALVMADAQTGDILGSVGSADYFDTASAGAIDMTKIVRSPGSTLKPFIYGLAFEDGIVAQETIIEDRPASFGGYRPKNFDLGYQGDVTIRQALQSSLNIPAIRLLDAVGPTRLMARLRRAGVEPRLPTGEPAGLPIGLGGVGLSLRELVQLYTGLANGGRPVRLGDGVDDVEDAERLKAMLVPASVWQVSDILSGMAPPKDSSANGIAYKTGTSYGYRDAWSVGYDGRHVLGVWAGRPDGGSVPGLTGYTAAAPILFEGFLRSGIGITPFRRAPAGAVRLAQSDLPFPLRRFATTGLPTIGVSDPAPEIVYPPEGARVDLGVGIGEPTSLVMKLNGGRAPFRWLANGKPLEGRSRRRTADWQPDGSGFATLTVIDAAGRAASVRVFVE